MTISAYPKLLFLMSSLESDFFKEKLRILRPDSLVTQVDTSKALYRALDDEADYDVLFGFLTNVIVPSSILEKVNLALNLHPGPPWMPGYRPTHKIAEQGKTNFGVTLHKMVEKVDTGPIIDISHFTLPVGAPLEQIEAITYSHAVQLALRHLEVIAGVKVPLYDPRLQWGKDEYHGSDAIRLQT